MKFTLSWLREHLETDADLETITDALTDLGLEVEGVEDPEKTLGAFTIGHVAEAGKHPNADKLKLCKVETAAGMRQVICGAPNARQGIKVVVAQPGDYIPGTDLTLAVGEIRGVESQAMMCSERELLISDDHDGIIELPADAPVGARYIDYADLNDPMIEIAITPNRPDALAVRGVARDLAARGLGRLIDRPVRAVPGAFPCPVGVSIAPDAAEACPLFIGRLIRGVKNGPSPKWLQRRLTAIGLRPINALVDVTNFFTYDRARPLHVFDAGKIEGDIQVRLSKPGESLVALDGKTYAFDDAMTLVCDQGGARPEGIGGVMGGEASGCSEETVDVFVEAAYFDPIRTAATGRKLKIHSDARYRFERGIDPAFTEEGIELATAMILELCGGEASELTIAGAAPDVSRSYALDPARVDSLVGMAIPKESQIATLEALGFAVSKARSKTLSVAVPPWRPDVQGEADLVEEIARVASLTKLEAQPLPRPSAGALRPVLTPAQKRIMRARRSAAALGLSECVTYTFIPGPHAAAFGGGGAERRLENPISSEMSDMRPSLYPGLLAAAARNQARGFADAGLFEIGPVFHGGEPGEEAVVATAIRTGHSAERHWGAPRRAVDLYDAKADAEALLAALGAPVEKLMIDRDTPPWYHPGRSARLKLGPKVVLAEFGELHPKTRALMEIKGPAVGMTLFLDAIPTPKAKGTARAPLVVHDLQAVERDFAFVVDERVEAAAVIRAARGADKKLITEVTVFDVFSGPKAAAQLGEGKKSVAVGVRLQPQAKTLTDKEIDAVADKIVAAVAKATDASLRG